MKINERLRRLRKECNMKLREVSKYTDLSISFISDIERGRTAPSLETCKKLARTYGCISLSDLFEGVEL
jgi:transcriptional regulator with XRE-family HTH domain